MFDDRLKWKEHFFSLSSVMSGNYFMCLSSLLVFKMKQNKLIMRMCSPVYSLVLRGGGGVNPRLNAYAYCKS